MRLATICARGGSKRLPGKALRRINNRPLIGHSIHLANVVELFGCIVASSDDQHILDEAQMYGADILVKRPPDLSTDEAGKVPAIRHALIEAERMTGKTFDQIIDLDVCAPMRTREDIRGFCAKLDTMQSGNLVSACKARRHPAFNMVEPYPYGGFQLCQRGKMLVRSQDAAPCYELNASMYGWNRADLLKGNDTVIGPETDIFEMPRERSWDIDDAHDLEIVEFLMSKQRESAAA
jgi:CMP-N,N'-diacetyllegionaminic acid synthase